jgi:PEP-CTERM motif
VFLTSASTLDLYFPAGSPDTVNALFIDGAYQPTGTWGAIGSGAQHESALFTGTGQLLVKTYVPLLPGDFNNDGKVDNGDYLTWRKSNGTNIALPNDNGLGAPVSLAHFNLWRQRYGNSPGTGSSGGLSDGAIPEPQSLLLVGIGLFGVASASCRRWR